MILNAIAIAVCGWSTLSAVGHRYYTMAAIGGVLTIANMWVAICYS